VPLLVRDPQEAEGVFRLLVHTSRTRGYIVAPIVQNDLTIGLLHADRFGGVEELDAFDLELVSLFATGLGWVMQRIAAGGEVLPAALQAAAEVGATAASLVVPPNGSAGEPGLLALTIREREVLGLMADGASNARIAESLVISEATVKSHVGHILRKLAAKNRTEAVSRYHGFLAAPGPA
jgi:DNA-binding CsgD family transcriptional regulator